MENQPQQYSGQESLITLMSPCPWISRGERMKKVTDVLLIMGLEILWARLWRSLFCFVRRLYLHRKSLLDVRRVHHWTVKWKGTHHLQFLGVLVTKEILSVINNTWIFLKCSLHVPTTYVQQEMMWEQPQEPQFFVSGHYSLLTVLPPGRLFFNSWAM